MVVEAQPKSLILGADGYKNTFNKYASLEKDGQKYMTQDDFLSAVVPDGDFRTIQREQYGLLFRLADRGKKGVLSMDDFVIFGDLVAKPDAEFEIAFKLFDVNGTGKITFDQFKQILSSNLPPDAVPFNFDCEWLRLYTAGTVDGHHELSYEEFSQLLKGLQGERLRQEFRHYDKNGTGSIDPESFKKIILDVSKHKLSDSVIDHLPTLANLYTGSKINFASVVAFHNVVRQMDMVEHIIRKAIADSKDKKITKADFLNTAAKQTRYSLFTPMEADIIFHFAGLGNPTGRLGLEDFSKLLDPLWRLPPSIPQETVNVADKKHSGLAWDLIESAYAFALGAIAGSVGATAVYPIDLVKTRMQNQRSKIVGELLYKNSIDCFRRVVANEGVLGLYRGLGPQLVVSWMFWFLRNTGIDLSETKSWWWLVCKPEQN